VARRDYGPCRPADLNWAAPYRRANPNRCPRYARVTAAKGASATRRALITYSGIELRTGSRGNAVKAVQKVVKVSADGRYGTKTKAAVQRWQRAKRIPANGVVQATTWRALLRAVR
jgi:peptidoglycan hydrolase-like protein with peptidoglycan-binding domain